MALGATMTVMGVIVSIGLVATCLVCFNPVRLRVTTTERNTRLRKIVPYLVVIALVLLVKRTTHDLSLRISHALGWDITAEIYTLEGPFVAALQNVIPEATLEFFSAIYVLGFPYLLVTPPVLYFFLPSQRYNKELLVAYALNYVVGSLLYTLFIAYGPRIHLTSVAGLMYQAYPRTHTVSAAISDNTNVFPSLHASLATTVWLFAWRSRREYPRWFLLTSFVVPNLGISTMYLGIHWLTDVVAGVLLAIWSAYTAERLVTRVKSARESFIAPEGNV